MKRAQFFRYAWLPLAVLLPIIGSSQAPIPQARRARSDIAAVRPEAEGFSSERLQRLDAAMQQFVDDRQLPGVVTLMARHGQVVELKAYGKKNLATGAPMTPDTIFRIYSMSKPVTGVAMMILYEEGKWRPSDPISKYAPEFAHLKVFKGVDPNGKLILEDPNHPPTMRELMTHTAGFFYGKFGDTPVHRMFEDERLFESGSLDEMMAKLARIPLLYQPGTQWVYSVSVDIQGYLVEKLSGKPLADFMHERIFRPLKMSDTGFYVPPEKNARFAEVYSAGANGKLEPGAKGAYISDFSRQPSCPSGGGGLVSTAHDYYRFAQMLLNGGELDGARVLAPTTVKLMTSNHLPSQLMTGEFAIGAHRMRPGFGYAYDGGVFTDPVEVDSPVGQGTYTWDGAAGTWFWMDPTNDIVFVGMIQRMLAPGSPDVEGVSRATVYQALVKP